MLYLPHNLQYLDLWRACEELAGLLEHLVDPGHSRLHCLSRLPQRDTLAPAALRVNQQIGRLKPLNLPLQATNGILPPPRELVHPFWGYLCAGDSCDHCTHPLRRRILLSQHSKLAA